MISEELQQFPVVARLLAWNAASVLEGKVDRNELTLVLDSAHWLEAARLLQSDPELHYDFLSTVSAVDWYPADPRFEVVYHLYSTTRHDWLRIKVRVNADQEVASVTPVWPGANWYERETFDLFGIRFAGHPDLRRIMMPDDWEGHPLRKDYPVEGYR